MAKVVAVSNQEHKFLFHCPGCKRVHGFYSGRIQEPNWQFDGNLDKPTIYPSILVNKDDPNTRCHSFVSNGMIQFLADCWHDLKNQTVALPDFDKANG